MNISENNGVFYIGTNLVECLTGKLTGKVFEVIATKQNGKQFNLQVQANNIDEAQKHVEYAARKDKVKFISFRITLLNK